MINTVHVTIRVDQLLPHTRLILLHTFEKWLFDYEDWEVVYSVDIIIDV